MSGAAGAALRWLVVSAACVAAAHALDGAAWLHLHDRGAAAHDWHRLLRVCGFLPTWLALAAVFALHDRGGAQRRAGPLVLSAGLSGLAAEIGKLLAQRERPGPAGEYIFRGLDGATWSTAGLGLPSSHAAVAFGAAWCLARLHPRGAPIYLALAAGCGLTRVIDRAHFASDVVAAAALAWAIDRLVIARRVGGAG